MYSPVLRRIGDILNSPISAVQAFSVTRPPRRCRSSAIRPTCSTWSRAGDRSARDAHGLEALERPPVAHQVAFDPRVALERRHHVVELVCGRAERVPRRGEAQLVGRVVAVQSKFADDGFFIPPKRPPHDADTAVGVDGRRHRIGEAHGHWAVYPQAKYHAESFRHIRQENALSSALCLIFRRCLMRKQTLRSSAAGSTGGNFRGCSSTSRRWADRWRQGSPNIANTEIGSTRAAFALTAQWRCGPVTRPVAPTRPTTWPAVTRSPS